MLVGGFFHLIIICITTIRDNINTSATNLWGGGGSVFITMFLAQHLTTF